MPAIQQRITKPLDQLEREDDVLAWFKAMLGEAREAQMPRLRQIRKNWLLYKGEHYLLEGEDGDWTPDTEAPPWRARVKRDIVTQAVEALRPILLRGYPKYIVDADYPDEPAQVQNQDGQTFALQGVTDSDLADTFTTILETMHESRNEGLEVSKLVVDAQVAGVAHRKVIPNLNGTVSLPILEAEQILPDPHGTRGDYGDHQYVIIEHEMDVADIERMYHIKERDFAHGLPEVEDGPGNEGLFRKTVRTIRNRNNKLTDSTVWSRRRYPVHEVYYHQGLPAHMLFGDKPPKSLRYPRGRQLIIINHKKMAISRHNPFWHGEFPLVSYQLYPLPHDYWGRSDVDLLGSAQITANILYNMVIANALLAGNNQWLYEEDALVGDYVTSEPGLMIPTAPGALARGAVQRLDPAPIARDVFNLVQELENYGREDIAGVSDALQGNAPSPNSSGVAINGLQAAAMTKQAGKMQNLDVDYRRQARLELLTLQQFGNFENPAFSGRHDMGEYLQWGPALRDLLFDVKVESRADLPHNVQARLNEAITMVQMGLFDLEQFMLFTGLKVRPELRQKIRQASGAFIPGVPPEIQAQLIMQGAGAGGGSGQGASQIPTGINGLTGQEGQGLESISPGQLPQV